MKNIPTSGSGRFSQIDFFLIRLSHIWINEQPKRERQGKNEHFHRNGPRRRHIVIVFITKIRFVVTFFFLLLFFVAYGFSDWRSIHMRVPIKWQDYRHATMVPHQGSESVKRWRAQRSHVEMVMFHSYRWTCICTRDTRVTHIWHTKNFDDESPFPICIEAISCYSLHIRFDRRWRERPSSHSCEK